MGDGMITAALIALLAALLAIMLRL